MAIGDADRRTILGAGALLAGSGAAGVSAASAQQSATSTWQPAGEDEDSWLDIPNTRHRMVFDTISAKAAEGGIGFANNFYLANETGYGLKPAELGVVLILRSAASPFGYNDAIWKTHGIALAKLMGLEGELAERAKEMNPLLAKGGESHGGGEAPSLSSLQGKGTRFAICGMATRGISGMLAGQSGGDADAIFDEIKENLIPSAVLVAAGIVAVNRAQERGYSMAYVQG